MTTAKTKSQNTKAGAADEKAAKAAAEVDANAFGEIPEELASDLKEVNVLGSMPTFVPAQEGYTEGMLKAGVYKGTKRVYSDKFSNPKKDLDGRKYRDLHVFEHPKAGMFGIWSVGILGFVMSRIPKGSFISIKYTGLASEALKKGNNPPHTFEFKGKDLVIDTNEYLGDEDTDADEIPAGMNRATGELVNDRIAL